MATLLKQNTSNNVFECGSSRLGTGEEQQQMRSGPSGSSAHAGLVGHNKNYEFY